MLVLGLSAKTAIDWYVAVNAKVSLQPGCADRVQTRTRFLNRGPNKAKDRDGPLYHFDASSSQPEDQRGRTVDASALGNKPGLILWGYILSLTFFFASVVVIVVKCVHRPSDVDAFAVVGMLGMSLAVLVTVMGFHMNWQISTQARRAHQEYR